MNQHLQRALVLLEQSRYELAEKELRGALADDPHDAHTHALLALAMVNQKQYDEATQEAQHAIHLAPDEPFPHYVLAIVLRERQRLPEALAAINEALRLAPYDANYHGVQSAIFIRQEKWRDALAAAERGLEIDPEDDDCTNMKAIALVKLGRKADAHAAIEGALARSPDNATTHANQGWTYLDQGNPKQALEHFREALRLDPTSQWARAGMLEALKARYFFYRWLLAYFLWMAKLSSGARWGVIIGGYVGYRVLGSLADANPLLAPWITPLLVAYGIFAISTWIASPLMNLFLRLNRFGKHLLTREERITSNIVGVMVFGVIISLISAALGSTWGIRRAMAFGLSIPAVSVVYLMPQGWPRVMMMTIAGVVVLLGTLLGTAIWWMPPLPWSTPQAAVDFYGQLMTGFIFAALGSQFAAMWLSQVVVRR
jgi:Tfp pilus assembly protein PilF